ncbi:unnamed protein product [Rotaria magnacalcarata]|uniref:Uncharacterized protein n=2 Tax=Rotaria magnacalcarata TaxID=392030 RepID=A0A817AMW5_9BILA|nr:unnamed protein product [Rotaria magnacalcarata]CAF1600703.1 unnamed protein product [Rotaria magnacalcarata]CAF2063497.1 unnamed protein product [Rotaria magnacalcarata]CAF2207167.1 unnamed protein product [Rotaria magnacalcarata]CAF2266034.1 unnamed protein product [Rotaria magnacalcarata]
MIKLDQHSSLLILLVIIGLFFTFINGEDNRTSCWSSSTVYKISAHNGNHTDWEINVAETEFVEECHLSFVKTITNKSCSEVIGSSRRHPTLLQKYGYGVLSIFIISALSLAGFVAFPLMKKPYYKYLNAFFTALAVGTLFADTAFELFPVIIEYGLRQNHLHEHGRLTFNEHSNEQKQIPRFLWQMLVLVLTAYVFYVIELTINAFMHHRHNDRRHHSSFHLNDYKTPERSELPSGASSKSHGDLSIIATNTLPNLTITADERQTKSTGWMIIIGDGIHNIADGLAIGAAFSENIWFGVTTSVAIACHELPTELGEYMVLIESGFTLRRALLFNFVSACTAFIGFFIGAGAAQNEGARTWIFAITAGTFAYIALVDLWPTLMPHADKFDWVRFICVTAGYLLGVTIMLILTIFDEQIVNSSAAN